MDEQKRKANNWYRLDNAAKLYPSVRNWRWSAMFRISALLYEQVDTVLLQRALETVIGRFPNFSVKMRIGIFWYYFEDNEAIPRVQTDTVNPCMRFSHRDNGDYMFRVRVHGRRIALEVFHALTDGYGALLFLKTLLAQYLRLRGFDIPAAQGVLDIAQPVRPEEMEDSFKRYAALKALRSRGESRAYRLRGTQEPHNVLHIITGVLPLAAALEKARARKVSLTEYLTSVLVFSICGIQGKERRKKKRPVKVSVPINMRNYHPTETMRNFSLFINPGIDPGLGEYTFEEILSQVHHAMRLELDEKRLNAQMSKNVNSERSWLVRVMPLFIKNFAVGTVFRFSEGRMTSTLSNLGGVDVPKEMRPHIQRFDLLLGPAQRNRVNAAVLSYGESLVISFTRTIREAEVERGFFSFLVQSGIPVEVESNGG